MRTVTTLTPIKLEEVLGCTKTERQRWTSEGKLPVVGYRDWKYGEYPVYDADAIAMITPDIVQQWRYEHAQMVKERRKLAARKAVETRKANERRRIEQWNQFQHRLDTWYSVDERTGAAFEMAFWTRLISRWAKYEHSSDRLYALKDEALKLLIQYEHTKIAYYRPTRPDRVSGWLCDEHRILWDPKWESFIDFVYENRHEVEWCCVSFEKEYYSLYYITLDHPALDDTFCFHVPYPVGKEWFPEPKTLEQVNHIEQRGKYRFGGPVTEDERALFPLLMVQDKLSETMDKWMRIGQLVAQV
jgi:hypothetical protein